MPLNTKDEIKQKLLLEDENQTVKDSDLDDYLAEGEEEMYSILGRSKETDHLVVSGHEIQDPDDSVTIPTFFRIKTIKSVQKESTDGEITDVSSSNYSKVQQDDAVKVKDVEIGETIYINYIPINYKYLERTIVIENLIARINPFAGEENTRQYAIYREKKNNFLKIILGNFGTAKANG